jgi:DNA-binding NarL/FixJ family response regulator
MHRPMFILDLCRCEADRLCGNKMSSTAAAVRRGGKPRGAKREQIRLLLAGDHVLILEGLAAAIGRQKDMKVVATAADGREALDLWKAHRPDVALLDLRMPKLNAVAVIREIRDEDVTARAIVLTTYNTDEEIYQAIRAGARAYLLKDAPLEELLDCIRKVHGCETCVPPALAAKLAEPMTADALTLTIVGADRLPASGYLRAKVAQENLNKASKIPFTIVRSTQFFEFAKGIVQSATEGQTVRLSPALMQPIAADDVAAALTDVALAEPSNG